MTNRIKYVNRTGFYINGGGGGGGAIPILLMPLEDDLSLVRGTGTATFTRSTTGTYVDKDDGLIKTAAIDEARFESNGILIEGASTNLALHSEDFTNAVWTNSNLGTGSTPTRTANFAIAPDGTTTADRLQFNLNGGTSSGDTSGIRQLLTTTTTGTISLFIKSNDLNTYTIQLSFSGQDLTIQALPGDFVRVEVPYTFVALNTLRFQLRGDRTITNTDTADVIVWGMQLEELPFATSYIPTTTTPVTRPDKFESNGVLIEGASTNQLVRSEEFDNASWIKSSAVVVADVSTSPDGTTTADGIQASGTGAAEKRVTQIFASGIISTDYVFSIFCKEAAADSVTVFLFDANTKGIRRTIDFATAAEIANTDFNNPINPTISIESLSGGWLRIIVGITTAAAGNVTCRVQPSVGTSFNYATSTGVDQIYVWGAQLDSLPFASSYIPTTTVTEFRAADNLSIDAANIPTKLNPYSISMCLDILGINSVNQRLYDVAGLSNRTSRFISSSDKITVFDGLGGVAVVSTSNSITGFDKFAFTNDTTSASAYLDGVKSDGTIITVPSGTETSISIGKRVSSEYLFGHIKNFRIYDVALTPEQVAAL